MKIGLYLMGLKGLYTLRALLEHTGPSYAGSLVFVVAAKDKNVQNDYFEDIKSLALDHSIPFFEQDALPVPVKADVVFAISWRWLIKEDLDKLIVFHDSLLPKYRGFNPLVTALIEGDREIGVTAIQANHEFDKGNIIAAKSTSIAYPIKIEDAIEQVSLLYGKLAVQLAKLINAGPLTGTVQDEALASYSLWRNEADYHINWNGPAERISRFIDALGYPYNGACTMYDGVKIIVLESSVVKDLPIVNRDAGKILLIDNNRPVVVCGTGLIKIEAAVYDHNREPVIFNKLRVRLNDPIQ